MVDSVQRLLMAQTRERHKNRNNRHAWLAKALVTNNIIWVSPWRVLTTGRSRSVKISSFRSTGGLSRFTRIEKNESVDPEKAASQWMMSQYLKHRHWLKTSLSVRQRPSAHGQFARILRKLFVSHSRPRYACVRQKE